MSEWMPTNNFFACAVYDDAGKGVSKVYLNPTGKLGVTTRLSEIIKFQFGKHSIYCYRGVARISRRGVPNWLQRKRLV